MVRAWGSILDRAWGCVCYKAQHGPRTKKDPAQNASSAHAEKACTATDDPNKATCEQLRTSSPWDNEGERVPS